MNTLNLNFGQVLLVVTFSADAKIAEGTYFLANRNSERLELQDDQGTNIDNRLANLQTIQLPWNVATIFLKIKNCSYLSGQELAELARLLLAAKNSPRRDSKVPITDKNSPKVIEAIVKSKEGFKLGDSIMIKGLIGAISSREQVDWSSLKLDLLKIKHSALTRGRRIR